MKNVLVDDQKSERTRKRGDGKEGYFVFGTGGFPTRFTFFSLSRQMSCDAADKRRLFRVSYRFLTWNSISRAVLSHPNFFNPVKVTRMRARVVAYRSGIAS